MKYSWIIETPIGHLGILVDEKHLLKISFGETKCGAVVKQTELIKEVEKQLFEYFSGKRKDFDLPLNPTGTEFQKKSWNSLLKIPYGKTISYKELALMVENEKYSRAVGMANNKNPIPIIIPCHRVIGANGKLVGYRGGLSIKEKLISIERNNT